MADPITTFRYANGLQATRENPVAAGLGPAATQDGVPGLETNPAPMTALTALQPALADKAAFVGAGAADSVTTPSDYSLAGSWTSPEPSVAELADASARPFAPLSRPTASRTLGPRRQAAFRQASGPIYSAGFLGRNMPITYDRIAPANAQQTAGVLATAMSQLSDPQQRKAATPQERIYLRAFRGFKIGPYRSGQNYGVYTRGVADYTPDVDWTASELIHDGVHAYLWRRGTRYDDEHVASEIQAAYLRRIGRPDLALRAHNFGMDPKAQANRRGERF